jgi:hypothetical protein
MKATKERVDEELMVIKLFASNYARDLMIRFVNFLIFFMFNGRKVNSSLGLKVKIFSYGNNKQNRVNHY